jgi:tellurite methyltransferase
MSPRNPYDEKYARDDYYWGTQPSATCRRVVEIVRPSASYRPRLIDLGCGEGRNAVYLAKQGFDVVGVDLSAPGLEKTRRLAAEEGVHVETVLGDICSFELDAQYDVVFSTGTLHYLPPEIRCARYDHLKQMTRPGGINAISVFVKKPFIPKAPDAESTAHHYRSGELLGYYWDWEILYTTEEIFDCNSSGVPHQHAVNRVVARKRGTGANSLGD